MIKPLNARIPPSGFIQTLEMPPKRRTLKTEKLDSQTGQTDRAARQRMR
ncbi:MAG: hypothetical protein IT583_00610, partial [Verrucomicrobia bacterium]|nr:hypothetical protein [Verrucomicrobiota bacterium]